MTPPRIMASSGGFVPVPGLWGVMRPGRIFTRALELTGAERPRVLLVLTASGDNASYLATMYAALAEAHCQVSHLSLFTQPNQDPGTAIGQSDLIWVGGGSVANLLAVWKVHGIDHHMRQAWADGTILGGVSAGSICWHAGGTTDSFGADLQPVTNALALVPYGNGVHYDSEAQRRPKLHELVESLVLPAAYATDDHVGILYEGDEATEVVTDSPVDPQTGPAAYFVERVGGAVIERRLPAGSL